MIGDVTPSSFYNKYENVERSSLQKLQIKFYTQ